MKIPFLLKRVANEMEKQVIQSSQWGEKVVNWVTKKSVQTVCGFDYTTVVLVAALQGDTCS